jgi:T5SS/PEP-CTERM-associated repeat protein
LSQPRPGILQQIERIMTTITANSTVGIYLTSPADTNPVVINKGVTISSTLNGVYGFTGAWTIVNYGSITAPNYSGVYLGAGGTVTNAASASISGFNGIDITGGVGDVVNSGSIAGLSPTSFGVVLATGGSVTNQSGGTISGYTGVGLGSGGTVTNAASASISGVYEGIFFYAAAGSVVNNGQIAGTGIGGIGIELGFGGGITNTASASITGQVFGVELSAGGTLTNAGTVVGNTGTAVYFGGTGSNLLVLDPGYKLSGIALGGTSATNTLELASAASTGTLSGLGTEFVDFTQVTIASKATWLLGGSNYLAAGTTITNSGTLKPTNATLTGSGVLINSGTIVLNAGTITVGSLLGTGWVTIQSGSTLDVTGSVASTATIDLIGSGFTEIEQHNTLTAIPQSGQTVSISQLTNNPGFVSTATVQTLVLNGPGTTTSGGIVSINTIDINAGQLLLSGGTLSATTVTVAATGDVSGFGTITGAVSNAGTIIANGGTLDLTGSVTGAGTLVVASGATLTVKGSIASTETIELTGSGFTAFELGSTLTAIPQSGQSVSITQVTNNPGFVSPGSIQTFVLNGPGTLTSSGIVAINTIDVDAGQLSLSGGTVNATAVTLSSAGGISGFGTVAGAETNAGTITASGGTLDLTGSVAGNGSLLVSTGATLLLPLGASAGAVTANGGLLAAAGVLNIGQVGLSGLLVENLATVTTGTTAVSGTQGVDISATAGGTGDAVVTGSQSLLKNVGEFLVGDAGLGSLSILSGGTALTTHSAGQAGAIIGNTSGASGSSVNVDGAGSNWQISGTLIVGNAGQGELSVAQAGSVEATAIDSGAVAGSSGDIVVNGAATQLTAIGQMTVGDAGNADLELTGGATISAGNFDIGLQTGASGVVDIEGASVLNVTNAVNVGDAGNAVLSLGADASVNSSTFNIGTTGVLVVFGDAINTGTLTNSGSFVVNGSMNNTSSASAEFINDGVVIVENSGTETIVTPTMSGTGSVQLSTDGNVLLNANSVAATQTIAFEDATGTLVLGYIGGFAGTINGFFAGDQIIVDTNGPATFSQSGSIISVMQGPSQLGTLVFANVLQASLAAITPGALEDSSVCFLAGTGIATPQGEVAVEQLQVGDLVRTLRGEARRIVWIGTGRVLATRGRRSAATPVIVQRHALANNVPNRDLRLTKGHALYLDGVLIPVDELVNHRSILWDDHAQEVKLYHVELETHDVLVANGAPAESYRDDGNRWLFQNSNTGWELPAQEPCAPVLTAGPVVDTIWRRLLERTGPRSVVPMTDDPDLHLMVDGQRVDALERHADGMQVFPLSAKPRLVRLVSRAAVPQEIGSARDPRMLGVAVRRIALVQARRRWVIEADAEVLAEEFHVFEPGNRWRWTDGDAALPAKLFAGMTGPAMLMVYLGGAMRYLDYGLIRVA